MLVTGAGGNFGKAFTRVFGRAGYAVVGLDIVESALAGFAAAADEVGADHHGIACDLRDWDRIEDAVASAGERFGRLDVVINTATVRTSPTMKPLENASAAEYDDVMQVGPRGALGVMRAALPFLKKSRGTIINIGSGAGLAGAPGLGSYGVSKAALHALTHSAALEWGKYGITVNGILPLALSDEMKSVMMKDGEVKLNIPPIGRMGDIESDIGAVALFLASPAASYINGQNISVDGGQTRR